ncbi:MAG: bifunctional diguanylate cyclase/phosphodiesterase [Lachnospiraceae bacterium]|nr:bifunctional diguanylate cyclase/phosphodiesterase [Lachnospiraceae bacterium]
MDDLRYQVDLLNAMNQRMQADEKMYRLVCDTSSNAFIYIDFKKNICKMLGDWDAYFPDTVINSVNELSKLYTYVEDQSVLVFRELLFLENSKNQVKTDTFKLAGRNKFIECRVNVIYDAANNPTDKVIRFSDVTKRKEQNDELTYMAYYDLLTGLYNRNYFVKLLAEFTEKAKNNNDIISVLFFDLDDFHKINDGMGIVIGDEVVQQFGFLLNEYKSDNVLISHFNADIYCMAIYNPNSVINAETIFKSINEKLKNPIRLSNGSEVILSFCMGVAEYPEAAQNTLDLINCAEIVMFRAKKAGRGVIQYFDAPILSDFLNNVAIENKLKEAVFENNFEMYFQPQYKAGTKKLRGVEALIRWKDYDGKMISPAVFIPIAEKNGAIIPIGAFVIEESIRVYSIWKKKYSVDFKLSINISAIQYRASDFVESLIFIIKKYDVDPSDIELEITESVLIDDFKDVLEKLLILREYGIMISLDDFGTGYSSLSYLKGLPIDTLKIDKTFIDSIDSDDNSKIILESIIRMSKKLGYETIAEGVESESQNSYIKDIGCDCIQGFYLSKPMNVNGIEDLLDELGY